MNNFSATHNLVLALGVSIKNTIKTLVLALGDMEKHTEPKYSQHMFIIAEDLSKHFYLRTHVLSGR